MAAGPYDTKQSDPMSPGAPDPMGSGMGSSALGAHSRAVMKAIKSGEPDALGDALKAFIRECVDEGYDSE